MKFTQKPERLTDQKSELRSKMKTFLKQLEANPLLKQEKDAKIFAQLAILLQEISPPPDSCFGVYFPMKQEIPIDSFLKKHSPLNSLAYPRANGMKTGPFMDFYLNMSGEKFILTKEFGPKILCPPFKATLVIPDIIFVPALAFDSFSNRLGMGRGYYDAYISTCISRKDRTKLPIFIGICYQEQFFEKIPTEGHDFWVDYVVSENFRNNYQG